MHVFADFMQKKIIFHIFVVILQPISHYYIIILKLRREIMEKRLSLFFVCLLMSIGAAFAQIDVSGTVISADDNEPIIGASVLISGGAASKGTVTDIDGKFKLNVPNGTKLVFSYVGMKSQTLAATANMKVVLRPAAQ